MSDLNINPDTLEVPVNTANAEPLPEPPAIKKYAKFHPDSQIQIETRQATSMPTDNTEDGSVWHEVDDYFVDGKHMIIDTETNKPRHMSDVEHLQWQQETENAGALLHTRNHRKVLLDTTDWVEHTSTETTAAWQAYRQALRDLPASVKDFNINWPTPPGPISAIHNPVSPSTLNLATGPDLNPTNGTNS